jgi:catechol 2,3-dioxygenase-like lactoylglutathione lyase family enzyme
MAQIVPILDHVVVNVLDQLDLAADLYRRLGFQLTERGHHTLGSSNHLAVFQDNYLELLGYEQGRQTERADLWKHPPGLTGLVFRTTDSLALHAFLSDKGFPIENPAEFSRPVALPEGARDAAFRVVRLGSQLIPNGRVFFCHHFTPELIWRDEWRHHPNGVIDVVEFVIATDDPSRTVNLYRAIFGPEAVTEISGGYALQAGRATIQFLNPAEVEVRFVGAAPTATSHGDRMAALTLQTLSLKLVHESLTSGHITGVHVEPDRIIVPAQQAGGVALAFVK